MPVSLGLLVDKLAKLQLRVAGNSIVPSSPQHVFEETMKVRIHHAPA